MEALACMALVIVVAMVSLGFIRVQQKLNRLLFKNNTVEIAQINTARLRVNNVIEGRMQTCRSCHGKIYSSQIVATTSPVS